MTSWPQEIERIELILSELLVLAKPQTSRYERSDICELLTQVVPLLNTQAIMSNVQIVLKSLRSSMLIFNVMIISSSKYALIISKMRSKR